GHDGQVAVREVDDLHHAEQERETGRGQSVEATEQDPLDDRVGPGHVPAPASLRPKYAASICSGLNSSGRPCSVVRPSRTHWILEATRTAWLTSCSTSKTAIPPRSISGSRP